MSGWKQVRHDPLGKTLPSRLFNFITRKLSGVALHDFNCGFKAYRREIFDSVALYGELHRFIPVLANGVAMTVFCWHMTALVAVIGLAGLVGVELGDQATLGWWLARPLWVLLPGVVLAGLVALFRGVETGRR